MRRLLNKFDYEKFQQVIIQVNNKSAIVLIENSIYYSRTKYIEIRYHFIREKVIERLIKFIFVFTKDKVVNELTKLLTGEIFIKFIKKLNLITIE